MKFEDGVWDVTSLWASVPDLGTATVAANTGAVTTPGSFGEVVFMPNLKRAPSFEEQVIRLRTAAVIGSLKPGKKATKRCRKRVQRVLDRIRAGALEMAAPLAAPSLVEAAVADVQRNCAVCRKCDGA